MDNKINKSCVLYFHINPLKNEIFYVGIGNKYRPKSKNNRNQFWLNTVNKYGYIIDIVETDLTWEEACEREKFYISKIGRRDLNQGSLVNLTDGGEGGFGVIPSTEKRNKISKSNFGKKRSSDVILKMKEQRKGSGNIMFNKHHKKESKIKMRLKKLGKKSSIETIEKVRQNSIEMWKNEEIRKRISNFRKKPVIQYTTNMNFVKEWGSAADVMEKLGIDSSSIHKCCKNKKQTAKGFIWKYKI